MEHKPRVSWPPHSSTRRLSGPGSTQECSLSIKQRINPTPNNFPQYQARPSKSPQNSSFRRCLALRLPAPQPSHRMRRMRSRASAKELCAAARTCFRSAKSCDSDSDFRAGEEWGVKIQAAPFRTPKRDTGQPGNLALLCQGRRLLEVLEGGPRRAELMALVPF